GIDVRNHAQQGKHGEVVGWAGFRFGEIGETRRRIHLPRVQVAAASIGETGGGHPVGGTLSYAKGMFQAEARIADLADIACQLKGVFALRQGEIVKQIVRGRLRFVTVSEYWIEFV